MSEKQIISQNQEFILGAQLENAKLYFVGQADTTAFNAMADGALAHDEHGYFRKDTGTRVYFADEADVLAAIAAAKTEVINELRGIVLDPATTSVLPTAPIGGYTQGRYIEFVGAGTVDGVAVESGGWAVIKTTIPEGQQITWSDLAYNSPTSGAAPTPDATTSVAGKVKITEEIPLDGSADHLAVATEKAVADALISVRDDLETQISGVQTTLQSAIDNHTGQISALDTRVTAAESSITSQGTRLTTAETSIADQGTRLTAAETSIADQGTRLTAAETAVADAQTRVTAVEAEQAAQDTRLDTLEALPTWQEEEVLIGDGTNSSFSIALTKTYIGTPMLTWFILSGGNYVRINSQTADVVSGNLEAAFAGVVSSNLFKVVVSGMVA